MRMGDFTERQYSHLICHASSIQENCLDLYHMHGIDTRTEFINLFPSSLTILKMRNNNVELTNEQAKCFFDVIEKREASIEKARLAEMQREKECEEYNHKYPIRFDEEVVSYRVVRDYGWR
jgi:hypothetical protein